MRYKLASGILFLSLISLAATPLFAQGHGGAAASGDRMQQMDRDRDFDRDRDLAYDHDRDRDRDHDYDRDQDRDRLRDRTHLEDPAMMTDEQIYGGALMSGDERDQYRQQLQRMETMQERERFQAQHEQQMQERARQQGKDLVPPGQGPVYGHEFMTVQERNQYREQLRNMQTQEEREQFMAQHRERMQLRAQALNREIEEGE